MKKIVFYILCVMLVSCSGNRKLSNQNLAYRYSPGLNFMNPYYRIYNISPDSTRVFFSVEPQELLFIAADSLNQFSASFSISYRLHSNFESKTVLDSGSRFYDYPRKEDGEFTILDNFDIRATDSATYILEITFSDLNRQQAISDFITINKKGIQSPDDFMIFDADWNRPVIKNYTDRPLSVRMHHNSDKHDKVYMRYFKLNFPLPAPPFSSIDLKTLNYNSQKTLLINLEEREKVVFDKPGIYHFQFDTLLKEGFTYFYFEEDFPKLTSADELIESIRYLTTRQEYDKILASKNKKDAVDAFWLSMAGNRERARILIKTYYSRVQQANVFFSSYMEGWKTDRGLMYIIFGPPASVYRNLDSESWNYSQNSYYGSLSFTFDKMKNPFSENDFQLRRTHYYEIPWYRAVDSWREGRVVNDNY